MLKKLILVLVAFTPTLILAAGLVPCGGPGEPACQFCHVAALINNVTTWLVQVLGVFAAIVIVVAGLKLASSVGSVSAKQTARRLISNVLFGYVLVLAGWLLVDTLLRAFTSDTVVGTWYDIQCVAQPEPQQASRPTASGDNASTLPSAGVDDRVEAIEASGSLQTDIINAARAAGLNEEQIDIFRALISQESSNCTNRTGPATSYGTAYGCGQLLVSTARGLDPSLSGLSDAEVAARLRDNNQYNLTLSARYFDQLIDRYGSIDLALAAYNGGAAANLPSRDCPGQRRWQCVWDSPGCYNTGATNCTPNTGYQETRNYVTNIRAIASRL